MVPQPPAPPPARPPVWPVFASFAVVLAVVVPLSVVLVVPYLVAGYTPDTIFSAPGMLPLSAAVTEVTLVAATLLLPRLFRDAPAGVKQRLAWRPERTRVLDVVVLFVLVIAVGTVLEAVVNLSGGYSGNLKLIAETVRTMGPLSFVTTLVFGAAGAGIGEELFFRGLAQTRLVERWGPWPGIAAASALFGLIHADPLHTPMAFCIGLVLGWAAWRARSIVPGVIAHALNNALSFTQQWRGWDASGPYPWPSLVTGAVLAVVCVLVLRARWPLPQVPAPVVPAPEVVPVSPVE